ncbi:MAG: S16 family serine protease [Candidatus Aenigmatarchaeota archaeon]
MKKEYVVIMGILFLVGLFVGFGVQDGLSPQTKITEIRDTEEYVKPNITKISTDLVAVDEKGEGVTAELEVLAEPGNGRTSVNIDKLFFWVDTQSSIRSAKRVATNYLNITGNRFNIVYTVNTDTTVVGGPSAGAMLAITTIKALQNESLKEKVTMTGTINQDGTIGPVGGILAKAYAAKEAGYETFLVPEGQGTRVYYEKSEDCREYKNLRVCSTDYEPKEMSIENEVGIDVEEVENIKEAMKYFE